MAEPLSVAELKRDLRLSANDTSNDANLARLIAGARRALEIKIGRKIVGEEPELDSDDLELAKQAISMIAAAWFACPEGVSADSRGSNMAELPVGVGWIIEGLQKWPDE